MNTASEPDEDPQGRNGEPSEDESAGGAVRETQWSPEGPPAAQASAQDFLSGREETSSEVAMADELPVQPGNHEPQVDPDTLTIAYFDDALRDDQVTFEHLQQSWTGSFERWNPNSQSRELADRYWWALSSSFTKRHPTARTAFGSKVPLFALCENNEINVIHNAGVEGFLEVDRLVFNCVRLSERAKSFLGGEELETCMSMIFDVVAALGGALDGLEEVSPGKFTPPSVETLTFLNDELSRAQAYLNQAAQRRAQVKYIRGMLMGTCAILLVMFYAVVTMLFVPGIEKAHASFPTIAGCIISGCIAAMVSVMIRMSRGSLILDYTMGAAIEPVGIFRPILGAVFGVLVYVILSSGLIEVVSVPTDPTAAFYYFLSLSFIAGFSERFVQDMLSTTEGKLSRTIGVGLPEGELETGG